MKLRHSVACCMLALGTLSAAQVFAAQSTSNQGYYRAPALHDQTLVFTAEGDLWTQTLGQKAATRLTTLPAEELGAAISADGKWVAYVANYEGASEVYVIPVTGGVAKRVSFENSRVRVQGWTSKGEVLYSTDAGFGPANNWMLRLVNPESLTTTDLPLADAVEGVVDANNQYVYFTRFGLQVTGDNAKVYRGGAKGELWRFKLGGKDEAQLLSGQHQGSVRQPMLWQDRLYFISDSDGNDNLWSMALDGSDAQQLTQYKEWQMRGARMDQGKVVFQLGADIHIFDIASAKDSLLNIELISDFAQRREHWVKDPMDYATSANLAPAGDKVVITARSHVAIAGIDGSRLVQVALPGTYRVRNAILSQDGKSVYAISDMTGQQEVWQFPADGTSGAKQLTKDGNTLRMSLSLSNDGRYLAHDDNDGNVWLLDLKKNTNQKIISHGEGLGPYADIRWSGDSRFIALTKSEIGKQRPQVVLYSVDESKAQALTSDKYESYSPTFSRDGQWLYFLSNRQFTATPSSPWGDRNMGPVFDKRSQIFAISLVKNAKFPFSKPTELTAKTTAKAEAKDKSTPVKIDWAGISERLWQVPVDSGNYSQLSVIDDRLYVLDQAIGDESQPNLMTIKFTELRPKAEVFAEDVANYGVSADGKKLLLRKKSNEKSLLIVDAGDKLGDTDNAKVQTDQWQLAISPTLEWQQMFEDAWLMHRDSFFDKNMRGLDWQATKAKYQPLLDRLTDRNELNDIFMQMMGELDSLHSQVRGGDLPKDPDAAK
ncbi:MAG: S41 family peptidase, partial [Shewanella sp.]